MLLTLIYLEKNFKRDESGLKCIIGDHLHCILGLLPAVVYFGGISSYFIGSGQIPPRSWVTLVRIPNLYFGSIVYNTVGEPD